MINMISVHARWNFTVGEVQLDISKGKKFNLLEHSGDGAEKQKVVCLFVFKSHTIIILYAPSFGNDK